MMKADWRNRMIAPFSGTGTYTRSRCIAIGQIWTRQIPFGGERYTLLQRVGLNLSALRACGAEMRPVEVIGYCGQPYVVDA